MYKASFNEKVVTIPCICSEECHVFTITFEDEWRSSDGGPSMTISTQLHQWQSFWKRLKLGIQYIFNSYPVYGHWDTTMVSKESAVVMRDNIEQFLKEVEIHEKKTVDDAARVASEQKGT